MNHCLGVCRANAAAALTCLLLAAGAAASAHSQPAAPKTIHVLMISDIHFDPFCDSKKIVEDLNRHDYVDWQGILDHGVSRVTPPCVFGNRIDTSYALLKSSFDEIRKEASGVDFVTVSGDLLAHDLLSKYRLVFPSRDTKKQDSDYARFAENTANFVIHQIKQLVPGVPVFVALGNNDSACDDYRLHTGDEFLKATAKQVTEDIPASERGEALAKYQEGGFYSVSLPAPIQNARLLVVEDVYWAHNYHTCGGTSAAAAELNWLDRQFAIARTNKNKEALWVMGHIPTGVDPYGTLHGTSGQCSSISPSPFLDSDDLFNRIAGAGDVIRLGLFAHTHMDEIKLLEPDTGGAPNGPVPVKVLPSISPFNGNNPTFTIAEIDPATATMMNYQVYFAASKTPTSSWKTYDYAASYGESSFTAAAVEHLIAEFAKSSGTSGPSQAYIGHYQAGTSNPYIGGAIWSKYVCTMSHDSASGFEECACPKGQ